MSHANSPMCMPSLRDLPMDKPNMNDVAPVMNLESQKKKLSTIGRCCIFNTKTIYSNN